MLKNIIIFLTVFLLIMWIQHNDDIRFHKKRHLLLDQIKIPLTSAILVILIKEINIDLLFTNWLAALDFIKPITPQNNVMNNVYINPPNF
jgi:hypothetical protein